MKKMDLAGTVSFALLGCLTACHPPSVPAPQKASHPLAGAWERSLEQPPGGRQIKIWTEDRFVWSVCDAEGSTMASGSGRYTYRDGRYVEVLETGPVNLPALRGKALDFQLTFGTNQAVTQSGTLPGIGVITETYTRLPAAPTP